MKAISMLNDVIRSVMRGPSSSYTAGSHHLAMLARSLLGEAPAEAVFAFDPDSSYARSPGTWRRFMVSLREGRS